MSREDLDVVLAAFGAFEAGDMEGVLSRCHEDIVIVQPEELPDSPARLYGHEGVRESFAIWPEQWDDFRIEVLRTDDFGERVMVTLMTRGRGKSSGVDVEAQFSFVFAVRAGRIGEWWLFLREEDAREAAGAAAT